MIYNVIGLMSGSSLDGLDIVFTELTETAGNWTFEIGAAACIPYGQELAEKLKNAINLPALDYQLLDTDFGRYMGQQVNEFIERFHLHHKVNLIASHGHTTFHLPAKKMTHQLGDGAALAAETGLPVVSSLRSMDIAFGGQGAPIVPMGEKLLFSAYQYFLNIGGIANISAPSKPANNEDSSFEKNAFIAFDICPANRVLNMLAAERGKSYDEDGVIAASGKVNRSLLEKLNSLSYYSTAYPKSLANDFGTDVIFPIITAFELPVEDALCTYVEHIAWQIKEALVPYFSNSLSQQLMVTGGGAFNRFLVKRIAWYLSSINFEPVLPAEEVIVYKEALIMALLGTLRWREQNTVLASVTGASRDSIGGALWLGTEA